LYGVGKATQAILESFGIRTVGQLAAFPVEILRRRFGKFGDELIHKARGEGSDEVLMPHDRPQERSMSHETTFSRDLTDPADLLGRLHHLSERVARRLRAADMAGRVVSIRIRYKGFETVLHGCKIPRYIQHEMDIFPIAEKLFHESYRVGEPVRLVGIHVADLIPSSEIHQQELFVATGEDDGLCGACDEIKDRYGEHAIGFASGVFSSGDRARNRSRRLANYNPFHFNPLLKSA
jgi:DNA polymerase IV